MTAGTASRANGHRMARIAGDPDAVFAEAIGRGVLSKEIGDPNFAGHFMYMFHDANDTAWFKHRETRAYVTMEATPCNGLAPCQATAACQGTAHRKGAAGGNEFAGGGLDERGVHAP